MDTEERVSEPLECSHDWMLWGTLVGIKKCRGAPLRAPQDGGHRGPPLQLSENGFSEIGSMVAFDGGRSLKRLHGPTALEFGCMGIKGKPDLKVFRGVDPVCPKCGPYEASEGTYSGHEQRKKLGGQDGPVN